VPVRADGEDAGEGGGGARAPALCLRRVRRRGMPGRHRGDRAAPDGEEGLSAGAEDALVGERRAAAWDVRGVRRGGGRARGVRWEGVGWWGGVGGGVFVVLGGVWVGSGWSSLTSIPTSRVALRVESGLFEVDVFRDSLMTPSAFHLRRKPFGWSWEFKWGEM